MKKFYLTVIILFGHITLITAQNTAEAVVQRNLEFYNKRDIEGFMSCLHENASLINFNSSEIVASGKEGIYKLYHQLFLESPQLHSTIIKRITIGNKVIDHELIAGRKGSAVPVELVMIYEVEDNKIIKMTVIRN